MGRTTLPFLIVTKLKHVGVKKNPKWDIEIPAVKTTRGPTCKLCTLQMETVRFSRFI